MSTNVPTKIPELVAWAKSHTGAWQTNATSIGLTVPQVQAFSTLAEGLTSAFDAANVARELSKGATLEQGGAVQAFRALAAAYISIIKGFAESTDNITVYSLAQISPDAPAAPAPPPIPPQTFAAGVNTDGSITIRWKVAQPAGVSNVAYFVRRRINGGTGEFQSLGTSGGKKTFTDSTLPVGVDRVEYVVTPKRGAVSGADSNAFVIQFGSVAGGPPGVIATSVAAPASGMKLAA